MTDDNVARRPKRRKRGLDILDRAIHTFKPMQDGQPYLARIKGVSMIFEAPSPIAAKRLADDFRLIQSAKVRGDAFPEEHRERLKSAQRRAAERKAG